MVVYVVLRCGVRWYVHGVYTDQAEAESEASRTGGIVDPCAVAAVSMIDWSADIDKAFQSGYDKGAAARAHAEDWGMHYTALPCYQNDTVEALLTDWYNHML